ncbi:hypothetical protein AS026_31680 [Rhizobium altiplani]|uniref:Uncharacterized protein n=1 Tax=Rhizobium altiplani TaxID=1864509 RepID=A0A109JYE7_9HYPH|nr:hypothetical protein AS026_31680 [Rhizobium altiplani]
MPSAELHEHAAGVAILLAGETHVDRKRVLDCIVKDPWARVWLWTALSSSGLRFASFRWSRFSFAPA